MEFIITLKSSTFFGLLILLLICESAIPAIKLWRSGKQRFIHALNNILLGFINGRLAYYAFFLYLWNEMIQLHKEHAPTLFAIENPFLATVACIVILDIWTYWWHRLNHIIPFLWRFHKVHHSDKEMDVTSANRFHTIEILFSGIIRCPLIFVFGFSMENILIYEIILFVIVQFHHANIHLPEPLDKLIRLFFPSPHMHKVHHSKISNEANSNYSSLLSIWDRVFRSFKVVNNPLKISYGIKQIENSQQSSILKILLIPFQKK